MTTNYPFTGCKNDGTEYSSGSNSRDLGAANNVGVSRPNSTASGLGSRHARGVREQRYQLQPSHVRSLGGLPCS